MKGEPSRRGSVRKLIDAQMTNLRKAVERLEEGVRAHVVHLQHRGHYTDADLEVKEPSWPPPPSLAQPVVLDLGANDGRFSAWRSTGRPWPSRRR